MSRVPGKWKNPGLLLFHEVEGLKTVEWLLVKISSQEETGQDNIDKLDLINEDLLWIFLLNMGGGSVCREEMGTIT